MSTHASHKKAPQKSESRESNNRDLHCIVVVFNMALITTYSRPLLACWHIKHEPIHARPKKLRPDEDKSRESKNKDVLYCIAFVHNMALIKTWHSSRPCVWEFVLFGLSSCFCIIITITITVGCINSWDSMNAYIYDKLILNAISKQTVFEVLEWALLMFPLVLVDE